MAFAQVVLTGLATNDPVPGVYLETNFAQGIGSNGNTPREVLLIGNKTTAGSATTNTVIYGPDTPVPVQTETDWINVFGAGSELHRMFRRFVKVNKNSTVRGIAVTESGGTAATLTITVTGTASGNGNIRTWVHDEFVDTAVASGDSASTIATNISTNISAMTHWGVTSSPSTNTVVLTAKLKGPRGNFIRVMNQITANITTTVSQTSDTAMSGGATADSNSTALTTILPKKYYYIVSAAEDATQLGALVTQVGSQALPTTGMRQRVFAGSVDTIGNVTTVATGINNARCSIQWLKNSTWTPSELAANLAAVQSLGELNQANPKTNFCGYGNDAVTQATWFVPAPRDQTAAPTRNDIKTALLNGISPIGINPNGTTYLVDIITTRSLNGSTADYRIRDAHKVTICDFFGDDLIAKTVLNFSGKRIANDVAQGARPPGPNVVTPTLYKSAITRLIDDYDGNDLLQNVPDIKAGMDVHRETSPTTRMAARIPLQPIDNAKQFAIAVDQVA